MRTLHRVTVLACAVSAVFCLQVSVASAASVSSSSSLVPNDRYWAKQWYLRQINLPEAWTVTTGSRNVIVAVIDGPMDIDHPDLRENIWTNPREILGDGLDNDNDGFVDDVHGWNFVDQNAEVRPTFAPSDGTPEAWGHGTMIASLIGAKGNDGVGMAGVAWNVQLMPLVALDRFGAGTADEIIRAMHFAADHGAKIINMSLAGYDYDAELEQTVREIARGGVVIVAATGNDEFKRGTNINTTKAYPACMDTPENLILGVSGTDTLDQKAPFANYGGECTDLSAPAQMMFGAEPLGSSTAQSLTPGYQDGITGTSVAAPLVSGVAALLASVHPEWTAQQIRERLRSTTDEIEEVLSNSQKGGLGSGRLNAAKALGVGENVLPPGTTPSLALATSAGPSSVRRGVERMATSTRLWWRQDGTTVGWQMMGQIENAGWIEKADGSSVGFILATRKNLPHLWLWDPVANTSSEVALGLKGKNVWRSSVSANGQSVSILFTNERSPSVVMWDGQSGTIRKWQPYGSGYQNGILRAALGSDGWLLWPTNGKGQALIVNSAGKTSASSFPFGPTRRGRWLLTAKAPGTFTVSGPSVRRSFIWKKSKLQAL